MKTKICCFGAAVVVQWDILPLKKKKNLFILKERENQPESSLPSDSPDGCNGRRWAGLKPGAKSFLQVSM